MNKFTNTTLWIQSYDWKGKHYDQGALFDIKGTEIKTINNDINQDQISQLTGLVKKDIKFDDWYPTYVDKYEDEAQEVSGKHDIANGDEWTAYKVSSITDLYILGLVEEVNFTQIKKILSERFKKALQWCRNQRYRDREFRDYWKGFFHGSGYLICVFGKDHNDDLYRDWSYSAFRKKDITYSLDTASEHGQPYEIIVGQDIYGRTNEGYEYSESERVDWDEADATITFFVKDGKFFIPKNEIL